MEEASYKIWGYLGTMGSSFPLKLHEEDEVEKGAIREQMGVFGLMIKSIEQG